jgi:hypothetical protein
MPADGKVGIGNPMAPESDANLTIGYRMPSVPDPNLQIESYRHRLPLVTECPRLIYFSRGGHLHEIHNLS